LQLIGVGASETAEFLMNFNDIFDAMNSSQLHDSSKLKSAFTSASDHLTFLKWSSEWFDTIQSADKTRRQQSN
jgi:hypothetical protein